MSDFTGAGLMRPAMPRAKELLADKGYDADWFREALPVPGPAHRSVRRQVDFLAIGHAAKRVLAFHKADKSVGRPVDTLVHENEVRTRWQELGWCFQR
jgi:hypothetical protein